ncbi:unnamed protein product [Schistocephalus solidus]|uniref:Uncharacterized protein n=1 Tax=Schistocephalus solidus TaxID=70667 RepID=A0A3P7CI66_SCHSO|nr:unnamed protein product [Schistocephalus solidus]
MKPTPEPKTNRLASTASMTTVKSSPSVGSPETPLPPSVFNASRAKSRDTRSPAKNTKKRSASSRPTGTQELGVSPLTYHRPPNVVPPANTSTAPPPPAPHLPPLFYVPTPQFPSIPLPPFSQVLRPPPGSVLTPPLFQPDLPPASRLRPVSSASAFTVPPPAVMQSSTSYPRSFTDQLNFLRICGSGGMETDSIWNNVRLDGEALVNCLAPLSVHGTY